MICQFSVGSNSLKMFHASLNYFSLNIRSTQSLQKFGLQSLSNHFKLVLMKRNLSRPNWCYWRIIQGQLQICPCIILYRLTIAWRLPDDCLTTVYLKSSEESWNRLALKVETEQVTYWQTTQTKAYNEQDKGLSRQFLHTYTHYHYNT